MTRLGAGARLARNTAGVPAQRSRATALHDTLGAEPSAPAGRDVVRWGAVWAGALTTLTTFVVLQLMAVALGWLEITAGGEDGATARQGTLAAALALLAFFHGGMLAGATSGWPGARPGLVNGVLVWALTVTGLLALALGDRSVLLELVAVRQTAGWTALGLGLAAAAAGLGGVCGARATPGRHRDR